MSLFRNESPNLGQQTTVSEVSGYGPSSSATNVASNNFKPTTREVVTIPGLTSASPTSAWVYVAPWQCQVVAVRATFTTTSSSGTLDVRRFTQAGLPQAPSTAANGTTVIELLTSALSLSGTANTTVQATKYPFGSAGLATVAADGQVLQAGDQLAIILGGTLTGLAGCLVQIEIQQLDGTQTSII
jgi:hypothetical protein